MKQSITQGMQNPRYEVSSANRRRLSKHPQLRLTNEAMVHRGFLDSVRHHQHILASGQPKGPLRAIACKILHGASLIVRSPTLAVFWFATKPTVACACSLKTATRLP